MVVYSKNDLFSNINEYFDYVRIIAISLRRDDAARWIKSASLLNNEMKVGNEAGYCEKNRVVTKKALLSLDRPRVTMLFSQISVLILGQNTCTAYSSWAPVFCKYHLSGSKYIFCIQEGQRVEVWQLGRQLSFHSLPLFSFYPKCIFASFQNY